MNGFYLSKGDRKVKKELQCSGIGIAIDAEAWVLGEDAWWQLTRKVGRSYYRLTAY